MNTLTTKFLDQIFIERFKEDLDSINSMQLQELGVKNVKIKYLKGRRSSELEMVFIIPKKEKKKIYEKYPDWNGRIRI